MSRIKRVLTLQLTPEAFDTRFAQVVCLTVVPAVLLIAWAKLVTLPLTQAEVIIALLASLAFAGAFLNLALVMPLFVARSRDGEPPNRA